MSANQHNTRTLYMQDSYLQETTAVVVAFTPASSTSPAILILDQTIFYAQGGGQPSDIGTITSKTGSAFLVTHVSYNDGAIQHKGAADGSFTAGEPVTLTIDWNTRYTHMQWHTAGHILDEAIKQVCPKVTPFDGLHGIGKKLYLACKGTILTADLPKIQSAVNQLIQQNLPITTEMVSVEEITRRKIKLPFALPTNKKLRLMQIGDLDAMPDGGTQLHFTGECWPITVTKLEEKDGAVRVHYTSASPVPAEMKQDQQKVQIPASAQAPQPYIDEIEKYLLEFEVDKFKLESKELGEKYRSIVKKLNEKTRSFPKEQVRDAQAHLKDLREKANSGTQTTSENTQQSIDLTMPPAQSTVGHVHPVSQAMDEITRIFEKIGFMRVRYPEVDWEWYPFDALNMPKDHPARDDWETFLIGNAFVHPEKGKMVLTPHTSNGQVREMERLNSTPPIRMINIARCYRRQADVTHTEMFHQFEGLVVDKGITIQHLKGTIDHFAREFYGPGAKSRIRPFHFQFTEPSFEVDFSCMICGGTGLINKEKCRFCKSGWHEVGGCGMVHPNVLKAGNIDPEEYTGFAFGWGIERTYTLREGLKLDDIRLLYSGDMRFLEQF